jgi:hypothetical protein
MTVLVPDPDLGPDACKACGASIVWALFASGHLVAVDLEPTADGLVELYAEYFPNGEPVDDVQRVRIRPRDRAPESPRWHIHWGAPRPCRSIG